jgi:hypothetical protein
MAHHTTPLLFQNHQRKKNSKQSVTERRRQTMETIQTVSGPIASDCLGKTLTYYPLTSKNSPPMLPSIESNTLSNIKNSKRNRERDIEKEKGGAP